MTARFSWNRRPGEWRRLSDFVLWDISLGMSPDRCLSVTPRRPSSKKQEEGEGPLISLRLGLRGCGAAGAHLEVFGLDRDEGRSTDAEGDEDVPEELLLRYLHPPALALTKGNS